MIDVRNDALDEDDFDTVLSSDIEFSGTLVFNKPFMIKGRVTGSIFATGDLYVAEGAVVKAEVRAPLVVVSGALTGNVSATKRVEVRSSGKIDGDIIAPEIHMETGCSFNGKCSMASPAPSS
jgi:cytoskeletal protein CcmA (bactofilin family)